MDRATYEDQYHRAIAGWSRYLPRMGGAAPAALADPSGQRYVRAWLLLSRTKRSLDRCIQDSPCDPSTNLAS